MRARPAQPLDSDADSVAPYPPGARALVDESFEEAGPGVGIAWYWAIVIALAVVAMLAWLFGWVCLSMARGGLDSPEGATTFVGMMGWALFATVVKVVLLCLLLCTAIARSWRQALVVVVAGGLALGLQVLVANGIN